MNVRSQTSGQTNTKKGHGIKQLQRLLSRAISRIRAVPRRHIIAGGAVLLVALCAYILWPQQIRFSYQGQNCINYMHAAPGIVSAESREFSIEPWSAFRAGPATMLANGICFHPKIAPAPGEYNVSLGLGWLPFIKKVVTVSVPSQPVVSVVPLKQPVPLTKRLLLPLSSPDAIFVYRLTVEGKTTVCKNMQSAIGCDLEPLGLQQGTAYSLRLDRYFKGKKVAKVIDSKITTLSAVTMVLSSIKDDETVYAKPKTITMQFDKAIQYAGVTLEKTGDGKTDTVATRASINGKEVTLSWDDDLPRRQSYQVSFERVIATDGSSLSSDMQLRFSTSGGPKVVKIDIGHYKVAVGSIATLTFDQPLSGSQAFGTGITASGGAKLLSRQESTVKIGFSEVPRCTDVVLKVTDELQSTHGISGGSAWSHATRTMCQRQTSIGTSVNGRSIAAYWFGSGARTIVYTGTIHGDEFSTRSLMMRWIDDLEANPRSIPSDKTVVIIPVVNPDGYSTGSRTNTRNVDLNRNFSTSDWQRDITTVTNSPFPSGGGSTPLSEPESAALARFIGVLRPSLVVSYHSIGGLVAANQAGRSVSLAQRYAALSGYGNSTGSTMAFEYAISGTADDYYAEQLGVGSILVELGSHTHHQFERNQKAMWAILKES